VGTGRQQRLPRPQGPEPAGAPAGELPARAQPRRVPPGTLRRHLPQHGPRTDRARRRHPDRRRDLQCHGRLQPPPPRPAHADDDQGPGSRRGARRQPRHPDRRRVPHLRPLRLRPRDRTQDVQHRPAARGERPRARRGRGRQLRTADHGRVAQGGSGGVRPGPAHPARLGRPAARRVADHERGPARARQRLEGAAGRALPGSVRAAGPT
jgi:hypothetical protein